MSGERDTRSWRPIVSRAGAFFLGGIFLFAAIGKLADPILFIEQIRHEGLDFYFSANAVALIALGLEIGLGAALVLGVRNIWVLAPTSALVAFFIFLTGRNYFLVLMGQRDPDYDCGCFGVFMERTATEAFWQDLFLLVPPLLMAFAFRKAVWSKLSYWKVAVSSAAALVFVVYTSYGVGLPTMGSSNQAAEVEMEAGFRPSSQFALWVNGEPILDAQIFESDVSLEILIVADSLPAPILIDVRNSTYSSLPPSAVNAAPEGAEIQAGVQPEQMGQFQVGSEGLQLEMGGRLVQLKNRG